MTELEHSVRCVQCGQWAKWVYRWLDGWLCLMCWQIVTRRAA